MRVEKILAVIILSYFTRTDSHADEWTNAEKAIRRLKPEEFIEAPAKFRAELESKKCLIPQPYDHSSGQKANMITGEFSKKGQKDWAALCSRDGKSSIIIYWGGKSSCSDSIAESTDKGYLQGTGNGIGYSRQLVPDNVVQPVVRTEEERARMPKIDHQGIQDIFVNKAAITHYCRDGNWLEVITSD